FAQNVLIKAKTLDINAPISAGLNSSTNWSVDLPASLTATLVADRTAFQTGVVTNPVFSLNVSPAATGDSLIPASYNARTNQIIVENVVAAAGNSSVSLSGAIISTNPLGMISVNSGVGQATVNNHTGIPLFVQNIDADGSASSKVQIIDTLKPAAVQQ